MQHKAVISFWVQGLLARRWHDAPASDRCCHPDCEARPPTRQELSARAAEDPGTCWERDPNLALTTAPITGADLIVLLLGEEKKKSWGKIEVKGMVAVEYEPMNTGFCVTPSV